MPTEVEVEYASQESHYEGASNTWPGSAFGLSDFGNLDEWRQDWYVENDSQNKPRVFGDGAWLYANGFYISSSQRAQVNGGGSFAAMCFRVAMNYQKAD